MTRLRSSLIAIAICAAYCLPCEAQMVTPENRARFNADVFMAVLPYLERASECAGKVATLSKDRNDSVEKFRDHLEAVCGGIRLMAIDRAQNQSDVAQQIMRHWDNWEQRRVEEFAASIGKK